MVKLIRIDIFCLQNFSNKCNSFIIMRLSIQFVLIPQIYSFSLDKQESINFLRSKRGIFESIYKPRKEIVSEECSTFKSGPCKLEEVQNDSINLTYTIVESEGDPDEVGAILSFNKMVEGVEAIFGMTYDDLKLLHEKICEIKK